jgi:putative hydrolase of the HAD superfamily
MNNYIQWSKVKGIVFDIGNVLIDIDYENTVKQFQKLSTQDFSKVVSYSSQIEFFNQYERGEISTAEFVSAVKKYLKPDTTDEQVIAAWNKMLVHYPAQKMTLLEELKSDFQLFALSNINELHIALMNENIKRLYGKEAFSDYFDKAFYSNEIGMRKPERRIYDYLINKSGISAEHLLFIDDKKENVAAASEFGIQTIHLEKPEYLYSFFEHFFE